MEQGARRYLVGAVDFIDLFEDRILEAHALAPPEHAVAKISERAFVGHDGGDSVGVAWQLDLDQEAVERGAPVLALALGELEFDDVERQSAMRAEELIVRGHRVEVAEDALGLEALHIGNDRWAIADVAKG